MKFHIKEFQNIVKMEYGGSVMKAVGYQSADDWKVVH